MSTVDVPKEVIQLVEEAMKSGVTEETFRKFLEEVRKNGNKRD